VTDRVLVREIPNSFPQALSMHAPSSAIDVWVARQQHTAYRSAFAAAGYQEIVVPADEDCPDCVFVEDTAVIVDGIALITRPGAPSRQPETGPIARALARYLELVHMQAPATLDGGDVMCAGSKIYVGRSARTNAEGIATLAHTFGRDRVVPIDLPRSVLHLKCVVSPLTPGAILLADETLAHDLFSGLEIVRAPREETYAANVVALREHVIVAEGYPRTIAALDAAGHSPWPVPTSEVCKADGSLTCQSLRWSA
jgi:dimethylargininase